MCVYSVCHCIFVCVSNVRVLLTQKLWYSKVQRTQEVTKVLTLEPGVSQIIALKALPTARNLPF